MTVWVTGWWAHCSMASGRILSRFGDVYGSVVNLAARLTSVARPGTILVDRELAAELSEEKAYELRLRRPVTVRGYNRLRPAALRRAREAPTGMFASCCSPACANTL